jgi:hypothetical protein
MYTVSTFNTISHFDEKKTKKFTDLDLCCCLTACVSIKEEEDDFKKAAKILRLCDKILIFKFGVQFFGAEV